MRILKKLYWLLTDKCGDCGGELDIWDIKKAFCKDCGMQN